MALPASMSPTSTSSISISTVEERPRLESGTDSRRGRSSGADEGRSDRDGRLNNYKGEDTTDNEAGGINEDENENSTSGSSSSGPEIDDDEVLRILSALDGVENENQNENENENSEVIGISLKESIFNDEDDNDEDASILSPSNAGKNLQQRLKGVYTKSQNKGGRGSGGGDRSSTIGNDIFEVVDNNKRVRDVRKSRLSDPPVPMKQSIFSAPLTENLNKKKEKSIYLSTSNNFKNIQVPRSTGNVVTTTVAEALEALRNKPNSLRNIPKNFQNRDEIPSLKGVVFTANPGLRMLAENPVSNPFGGVVSYEEKEVDRAIR